MSAIEHLEHEGSEDSDVGSSASESPKSGVHDARLLPPRPRPRALPGKEVLPAPGVPETPRRERNKTSSFWPAPPEPLKVPPARASKRGTPLTTTAHGFPAADLGAGSPSPNGAREATPAARRPALVRDRLAEVEREIDPDLVPPPPRSKRAHTDQGWPPPSGSIEPMRESFRDTKPHLERLETPVARALADRPANEVSARALEIAPAPIVAKPLVEAGDALRPIAKDIVLPSLFGEDEEAIELPIQKSSARAKWIALAVIAVAALVAIAALLR